MLRKNPAWQALQSIQRAKQKMHHEVSKQQAPGFWLGRKLGQNHQRESRRQAASGESLGRQSDPRDRPRIRVTSAFGRDTVKSHKVLYTSVPAAGRLLWCYFSFPAQRPKAGLTYSQGS